MEASSNLGILEEIHFPSMSSEGQILLHGENRLTQRKLLSPFKIIVLNQCYKSSIES